MKLPSAKHCNKEKDPPNLAKNQVYKDCKTVNPKTGYGVEGRRGIHDLNFWGIQKGGS
jgi:hypothetical protein